jgi:nitrate/nitrite transporter NarK
VLPRAALLPLDRRHHGAPVPDLPDGNYKELELSGAKQKQKGSVVLKVGVSNINAWILTLTYGFCFGVELTMNNIVAPYYTAYHGLSPQISGLFASFFGLMNIFARSCGGLLSDWSNKRYGMRGRLWSCWIVQTIEGGFCIAMAAVTMGMKSPDDPDMPKIQAYTQICSDWLPVPNVTVTMCGTMPVVTTPEMREALDITQSQITATTPPSEYFAGGSDCICNSNTAGITLFLMICFSLTVQAAEGLHFGIVPYVSRSALGIVSGMVGAGGNLGSVIALRAFFTADGVRTDTGIFQLGFTIIGVTALMFFIYFPDMGSMLTPAGALGKYDPQIIKPPESYRGADQMDYSKADSTTTADPKVESA